MELLELKTLKLLEVLKYMGVMPKIKKDAEASFFTS